MPAKSEKLAGEARPSRSQIVIVDPVLNSPFEEPARHWKLDEEGITNELVEARRTSQYFMPIPAARKKGSGQQMLPCSPALTGRKTESKRTSS